MKRRTLLKSILAGAAAIVTPPIAWAKEQYHRHWVGEPEMVLTTIIKAHRAASPHAPPGMMISHVGTKPPAGWLLCDGAFVRKSDYPDLFQAIGGMHGEDGDMFALPNLEPERGWDGKKEL